MRLRLRPGSAGLPLNWFYMSNYQSFLVVYSNLLSILMPAKVVKNFELQSIFTRKSNNFSSHEISLDEVFFAILCQIEFKLLSLPINSNYYIV